MLLTGVLVAHIREYTYMLLLSHINSREKSTVRCQTKMLDPSKDPKSQSEIEIRPGNTTDFSPKTHDTKTVHK